MKPVNHSRILVVLGLLLAVPLALARPAPAKDPGNVTVTYVNPQTFSEMRLAPASKRSDVKDNMAHLKRYIIQRAARELAPGQHLDIRITDLKLAGMYRPWNAATGGWMRVIKQPYTPRMDLHFTLRAADGKVLKQGDRKLSDAGFMGGADMQDSDPVRYSKAMVDRWLRREFRKP